MPSVIDEDIHATEGVERGGDRAGDVVRLGDIGDDPGADDARLCQLLSGRREVFVAPARNDHLRACAAQRLGGHFADATPAAGDQRDLAGEIEELCCLHG